MRELCGLLSSGFQPFIPQNRGRTWQEGSLNKLGSFRTEAFLLWTPTCYERVQTARDKSCCLAQDFRVTENHILMCHQVSGARRAYEAKGLREDCWTEMWGCELIWTVEEPTARLLEASGSLFGGMLHRDFQRPWNDVLGGCFPLSVADPTVLRVLGLRLLQAGWTQMSQEPLYLLPASVGRQVVAPWCGRPWDEPEHRLGLLCNNRLSILSAFKATYGGGPQDGERVRQSTGVFSLGSWRNLLHPGYPALCSGADPYGLCQWAPLLTDTQWARSSGAREASEIWAWAHHLPFVPPNGIALTSKEISEENVSLKCYMVPSHTCSKWLTMHMWSLPHIHSWNSGKLVWRDCDRRLWGTTSDLSSAASVSHCDCPSGNRDGASDLSMGSPLSVTGHFSLFPRAKHQIVQLLILHYIVTSCRQGASSFDFSWSYSQRHVVQSLSMRLWNWVSCANPLTGHLARISTLPACPVKVKVE